MRYFIIFLLFFLPVFATISEPFTIDLMSGYREDRLKIRLHLPGNPSSVIYQEDYNHLRFVQTEVNLKSVQRDLYFLVNGGYGAIGTSGMSQGPIRSLNEDPKYDFDTSGYAANVYGLFGYTVNLTPLRHYQFLLIPLFGYAYYYEKIKRKDTNPNPFTESSQTSFTEISSTLPKDLVTKWNGFFIGVEIASKPIPCVDLSAFYSYYFMDLRQTITQNYQIETFSNLHALISKEDIQSSVKVKTHGNHGHMGILKGSYSFNQIVSLGAVGKISYFTSHVRGVNEKVKNKVLYPVYSEMTTQRPLKYKFRDTTLSILFYLSFKI